MYTKTNIHTFNGDVTTTGCYKYSDSAADVAKSFSNSRSSRAILEAACLSGKTVIDIGCGDGMFTLELGAAGAKLVVGIDPADKAITSARQRARDAQVSNVDFQCRNVYDLDASLGHFDLAVVRGVLHHLDDPARAVNQISSICDEIVVLEPNGCNPVLKLIERFSRYHVAHEEQSFFPWTIDRWLRDAGKQPTPGKMINLVPLFCPAWFAKLLKSAEPIVESIPLVRLMGCGQYVVKAS